MWIISGTPQEELRFICTKLGFDQFFVGIFGSPKTKTEIGEKLSKSIISIIGHK